MNRDEKVDPFIFQRRYWCWKECGKFFKIHWSFYLKIGHWKIWIFLGQKRDLQIYAIWIWKSYRKSIQSDVGFQISKAIRSEIQRFNNFRPIWSEKKTHNSQKISPHILLERTAYNPKKLDFWKFLFGSWWLIVL